MKIYIIATEPSGDYLGSYLIKELKNDCEVVVTYRSSGTNFFFKHFQIKKRKIIEKSKLFVNDIKNIESFFEKKKKITMKFSW